MKCSFTRSNAQMRMYDTVWIFLPSCMIDPNIFRAYDIRGIAHEQVTEEACRLIGHAFGSELRERYNTDAPRVAVGRDARIHSPAFEQALIAGLQAAGCTVLHIGQTPSPVNYCTICTQALDGGVQVTASHNPPQDNGLKLQIRDAEAFAGEDLQRLRQRIAAEQFLYGNGSVAPFDAVPPYLKRIHALFGATAKQLHVVIDTGNGVAGPVYVQALRQAGCRVTELYTEPDGTFPNHPADPSKRETLADLQAEVHATGADCGLAFDGDGDRLGLVDENGDIRTADEILLLLAKDHLSRHAGAPVVFTVSNSGVLQSEIAAWGGKPVMCAVGHSFVEHTMRQHGAQLGGEQSGHFFCAEGYFGFDDALVAALRVLTILAHSGQPLSRSFAAFPTVHQMPEKRPFCPDDRKTAVVASATQHFQEEGFTVHTLDGARIDLGDGAWAGIRQSNTSPRLSIVIEARDPQQLAAAEALVLGHLQTYGEVDFDR